MNLIDGPPSHFRNTGEICYWDGRYWRGTGRYLDPREVRLQKELDELSRALREGVGDET